MKLKIGYSGIIKKAKAIKKNGGIRAIKVGLSNSDEDNLNRTLKESERILKILKE